MADVAAAERPAVNYGDLYASSSAPAADDELEKMREKHKQRSVAVVANPALHGIHGLLLCPADVLQLCNAGLHGLAQSM